MGLSLKNVHAPGDEVQHSSGVTLHEMPDRSPSPVQSGPDTWDKSTGAGNKLDSLVAKGLKPLTLKDQVVLIIYSTGERSTVSNTAPLACAILPSNRRVGAAAHFHLQVVTAKPEPGEVFDLLVLLLTQLQICRHLVRLCGFEV